MCRAAYCVGFDRRCLKFEGELHGELIEADMYLWNEDMDDLSSQPWELKTFMQERLDDWIDLFDGMELIGDDE
jgi:hypothetical protein